MITKNQIKECLSEFGPVHEGNKKHLIGTCYKCGKQDHFYINYITGLNDCKKCSLQGNIFTFLRGIGKLQLLQEGENVDRGRIKMIGEYNTLDEEEDVNSDFKTMLPIGFKTLSYRQNNKYVDYLKDRKFTEEDFLNYQPGYTELKMKFEDYVIIPIYVNYVLGGYVGRYIGTDKQKRRYENSKSTFSNLLFGFDEITINTDTVILVEGLFDKTNVNRCLNLYNEEEVKCCSTFGKKLSINQLKLLQKTKVKNIILFYDSYDAVNEMKKFGTMALDYYKVYAIYYDTLKDPGSMNKKEMVKFFQNIQKIDVFFRNKVQKGVVKLF